MTPKIDPEMLEIYKKEAQTSLEIIVSSLKKLKKDYSNQKEIFNLYRAVHTLKSSSFQMGFYSVGYLANLMNEMLKQVKVGRLELDDEKIAFLNDFSETLKKAVAHVLKNKEIKFDKKLFDKVEQIVGKSEQERIKNAELEMQKQIGKTGETGLFDLYLQTSGELIEKTSLSLKKVENKFDAKALNEIISYAHTLEGNSLQMGYYIMGYFASKIKSYVGKILLNETLNNKLNKQLNLKFNKKLKKEELAYLDDLFGTIKIYFHSLKDNKEILSQKLVEKLNLLIQEDYAELERKIKSGIVKK